MLFSFSKIDSIVDKFNKKIARILGKRGHGMRPPKSTSNKVFWLIMLLVFLFLWGSTGIYYLSENMYGIILHKGKFSRVVKGLRVGLTLPIPFERIIIIDAEPSYLQYLGNDGDSRTDYNVELSDSQIIGIKAQFLYQITDPKMFYIEYLQNKHNHLNNEGLNLLHTEIEGIIKKHVNNYIAYSDYHDAVTQNLAIMGGDVKKQANQELDKYGVSVIKLNIISIHKVMSNVVTNQNVIRDKASSVVIHSRKTQKIIPKISSIPTNNLAPINNPLVESDNESREFNRDVLRKRSYSR